MGWAPKGYKIFAALAVLSLQIASEACDAHWQTNTAGNWSNTANWFEGCVPMTAGDTAFLGDPTTLGPVGPVAINLDINATVSLLTLQNSNSYAISNGSNFLNFQNAPLTIQVNAGSNPSSPGHHVISSQMQILSSSLCTLDLDAGTQLDIYALTPMGSTPDMALIGAGQVNVPYNGASNPSMLTLVGSNTLTISNGTLNATCNAVAAFAGSQISIPNLVVNGTGNLQLTNTQNGVVMGSAMFGAAAATTQNMTITGNCTVEISNYGTIQSPSITGTLGATLFGMNQVIVSGGTITISDFNKPASPPAGYVGAAILSGGGIVLQGGAIVNNNGYCIVQMGSPLMTITAPGILAGHNGIFANSGPMGPTPISAGVVTNNGTMIPGDPVPGGSPGILNVVGTYTQGAAGTFVANILNAEPGNFSQLLVTQDSTLMGGVVNLAGTLQVAFTPGFSVSSTDQFIIIQAPTINGVFDSIVSYNLPAGYIPQVIYDPAGFDSVILYFLVPAIPTVGSYPAFYQTVFASGNHRYSRLEREMQRLRTRFHTPDAKQIAAKGKSVSAVGAASGQLLASAADMLAFIPWQSREKQHQLTREAQALQERRWNFYLGPLGSTGDVHHKKETVGFDYWSAGAQAGFDYAFNNAGVGLLVDYEHFKGKVHDHWGKFDLNQFHASLYTTVAPDAVPMLAFNGILGGGYDWVDIHRNTSSTTPHTQGRPRIHDFDALFGVEYTFSSKPQCGEPARLQFIPMATVQYTYLDISKYNEHHAGAFDQDFHSQLVKSLRSTLGAWLSYVWNWTHVQLTAEANGAWQREYFDQNHLLRFSNPMASSSVAIQGAGRNTYQAGVDLLLTLYEKYGIEASYDYEWNQRFQGQAVYLGFNVRF
jgi:uncharacterized protein YhjY with autotransporter beta-barrel domain